jgi:hypothetical protein
VFVLTTTSVASLRSFEWDVQSNFSRQQSPRDEASLTPLPRGSSQLSQDNAQSCLSLKGGRMDPDWSREAHHNMAPERGPWQSVRGSPSARGATWEDPLYAVSAAVLVSCLLQRQMSPTCEYVHPTGRVDLKRKRTANEGTGTAAMAKTWSLCGARPQITAWSSRALTCFQYR